MQKLSRFDQLNEDLDDLWTEFRLLFVRKIYIGFNADKIDEVRNLLDQYHVWYLRSYDKKHGYYFKIFGQTKQLIR